MGSNEVYKALTNVLNGQYIDYIHRPEFGESNEVISFHFFNIGSAKEGDGRRVIECGALQVDYFVKHGTIIPQADRIAEELEKLGFRLVEQDERGEYVDGLGNLDQYILTFNFMR